MSAAGSVAESQEFFATGVKPPCLFSGSREGPAHDREWVGRRMEASGTRPGQAAGQATSSGGAFAQETAVR